MTSRPDRDKITSRSSSRWAQVFAPLARRKPSRRVAPDTNRGAALRSPRPAIRFCCSHSRCGSSFQLAVLVSLPFRLPMTGAEVHGDFPRPVSYGRHGQSSRARLTRTVKSRHRHAQQPRHARLRCGKKFAPPLIKKTLISRYDLRLRARPGRITQTACKILRRFRTTALPIVLLNSLRRIDGNTTNLGSELCRSTT
jgi:hypothetical protein